MSCSTQWRYDFRKKLLIFICLVTKKKNRWDEMGMYDVPAELNYILNVTGQKKLTYVGHSMGNSLFTFFF